MNFQSLHFLLFLGALVVACGVLRKHFGARKNLLLLASYYFYMSWDWRFGALLAANSLLFYTVARRLHAEAHPGRRRLWLGLALAGGLGVLGYFKYANFFIRSAVDLAAALGVPVSLPTLQLVLPIGISFFTFQGLSYVIDVYRRQIEPTEDLRDAFLFVGFFATVLAGPITRGHQLLPQLEVQHTVPAPEVEGGLALVARGFVKKIVFADVIAAALVDPVFADPAAHSRVALVLAVYAYSFQIYMDVSGYTDIARGAALLCGFRLPENFNRPYAAQTVSNFWQRWHMTMSGFFRDYVFVGLGGSRHGNVYFNLMLTFLAIGLWHGGGWNFLLYGALHGGMVCVERWLRKRRESRGLPAPAPASHLPAILRILWVFSFVSFTRILFRSPDLEHAGRFVLALFDGLGRTTEISGLGLGMLLLAAVLHWGWQDRWQAGLAQLRRVPVMLQAFALVCVTYAAMTFSVRQAPFVYFNF